MSFTLQGLTDEVERRLHEGLPSTPVDRARHISVSVHGDRIVLNGTVDRWADHQLAELLAASTPGVKAVDNRLSLLVHATVER